jgi:hypothetical protein
MTLAARSSQIRPHRRSGGGSGNSAASSQNTSAHNARTPAADKIFGRPLTDPLPNRDVLTVARRTSSPEPIDERVALFREGCSDSEVVFGALVQPRRRRCRPRAPPRALRRRFRPFTARFRSALRAHRDCRRGHRRTRPAYRPERITSYVICADAIDIVAPLLDWLRLKLTRWAHVRDPALDRLHRRRATARSWRAVWTWRLEASTGPV